MANPKAVAMVRRSPPDVTSPHEFVARADPQPIQTKMAVAKNSAKAALVTGFILMAGMMDTDDVLFQALGKVGDLD